MLHVRHVFYKISASSSAKQQLEITTFAVLKTTFRKQSLLFCFYLNSSPVEEYFANVVQFKQDGILLRQLCYFVKFLVLKQEKFY